MSLSEKTAHFISRWWPTALCAGVILYATLSADPTPDIDMGAIPNIDKLIHAIMFGGLAGAATFDMQREHRAKPLTRRTMLTVCAVCIVAGGLDEIAQAVLTENRGAEWADFAADIVGIAVAFFTAPPAVRRVLKIGK